MKKYKIWIQKNNKSVASIVDENELPRIKKNQTVIKIKELKERKKLIVFKRIKNRELLNVFIQLEMILKSKLTLNEALSIVIKSCKRKAIKELLLSMQSAIKSGQPIVEAFYKYEKQIDPLIISFFKIAQSKGNTTMIISAICEVLSVRKQNKELITSSLSYPLIIFCSFIMALGIIFYFVIPKFEYIFIQYNLALPIYTKILLSVKDFFMNYGLMVFFLFLSIFLFLKQQYKRAFFKYKMDYIISTKIPFFSKIYSSYELHNFFICLQILSKSNYEFNIALENSLLLLKNKYLFDRIQNIYGCIKSGMSIHESFAKADVFDEMVLNLINSAEMSSNMNEALEKIEEYYKYNFTKNIKRFSSLIEPTFFTIMMLLILWVMLAIFTPIWNMSEMLNL